MNKRPQQFSLTTLYVMVIEHFVKQRVFNDLPIVCISVYLRQTGSRRQPR